VSDDDLGTFRGLLSGNRGELWHLRAWVDGNAVACIWSRRKHRWLYQIFHPWYFDRMFAWDKRPATTPEGWAEMAAA